MVGTRYGRWWVQGGGKVVVVTSNRPPPYNCTSTYAWPTFRVSILLGEGRGKHADHTQFAVVAKANQESIKLRFSGGEILENPYLCTKLSLAHTKLSLAHTYMHTHLRGHSF